MITDTQKAMLEAPLDPKHVKEPSGSFGPKGDYLEGWHVINELNRIFGFDGWSYTIELSRDSLEKADGKDQWQAAYTCICTLRVGEVTRQDVGFGSGFAKQVGDAIEGATKEAATDALKRSARTFGNAFGLALYDKTRVNVCAPPVALIDQTQRGILIDLARAADMNIVTVCEKSKIKKIDDLPADKFAAVEKWLGTKIDELNIKNNTPAKELETTQ